MSTNGRPRESCDGIGTGMSALISRAAAVLSAATSKSCVHVSTSCRPRTPTLHITTAMCTPPAPKSLAPLPPASPLPLPSQSRPPKPSLPRQPPFHPRLRHPRHLTRLRLPLSMPSDPLPRPIKATVSSDGLTAYRSCTTLQTRRVGSRMTSTSTHRRGSGIRPCRSKDTTRGRCPDVCAE